MASFTGKAGRLSRLLSFVSLLCLIALIIYVGLAGGPCQRIRNTVYAINDLPAKIVLTVLQPWAQSSNIYWRADEFFRNQRFLVANFMARQLHGQPSYEHMCVIRD